MIIVMIRVDIILLLGGF